MSRRNSYRHGGRDRNRNSSQAGQKQSQNSNQRSNGRNQQNNNQTSQYRREEARILAERRAFERKQFEARRQKDLAETAERESAIKAFKSRSVVCEICGQPLNEMGTAFANRGSGNPVHFDCVLRKISEGEKLSQNDRMTYIGNGKFAVLHFENPHDMRHFSIVKTIEWEGREKERSDWRNEMAGIYSQVR